MWVVWTGVDHLCSCCCCTTGRELCEHGDEHGDELDRPAARRCGSNTPRRAGRSAEHVGGAAPGTEGSTRGCYGRAHPSPPPCARASASTASSRSSAVKLRTRRGAVGVSCYRDARLPPFAPPVPPQSPPLPSSTRPSSKLCRCQRGVSIRDHTHRCRDARPPLRPQLNQ